VSAAVAAPEAPTAPRTISSRRTPFARFAWMLWFGGLGGGTLGLWLGSFAANPPPAPMKWIFLVLWVLGTASFWWLLGSVKKVRLDATALHVSDYRREIAVPLAEIESVSENWWMSHHPVTLHLRHDTPFGRKITFIPTFRLLPFWRTHPIVNELRRLARSDAPSHPSPPALAEEKDLLQEPP
jgi:hypothetical protein